MTNMAMPGREVSATATTFTARDGAEITSWHWPAQPGRPLLHWAHATGFHARTYTPLLNALSDHVNVVAWDMRGHGHSHAVGDLKRFRGWESYYDDLSVWLEQQTEPVILAGHSVGATTSLVTACRMPEHVAGVLLCDPVLIGGRAAAMLGAAKLFRQAHRFKLAAGALTRRQVFESRQAAYNSYRSKAGFRRWPDEWLRAYVEGGFLEQPTSAEAAEKDSTRHLPGQVHLACAPAWESRTFATTEHRPWHKLTHIAALIEVLAAQKGSTFPRDQRPRLERTLPTANIRELAGCSHFLPMEQPQQVLETALNLIRQTGR